MEALLNNIRQTEDLAEKLRMAADVSDADFVLILYARSLKGDMKAARLLIDYGYDLFGGDADA